MQGTSRYSISNIETQSLISKTQALSKVFESFIFDCLFEDINDNIDSQQFGFRSGQSTVHYLVAKHLENNWAYVDALFADIVKAFDSLDHNVVVEETKVMGTRPFVVRMLASFLFERYQCVQLPDHEPSEFVNIFVVRHKGLN